MILHSVSWLIIGRIIQPSFCVWVIRRGRMQWHKSCWKNQKFQMLALVKPDWAPCGSMAGISPNTIQYLSSTKWNNQRCLALGSTAKTELQPKQMSIVNGRLHDFHFFYFSASSRGPFRNEAKTIELRLSKNYKTCRREIWARSQFCQFLACLQ